MEIKLNGNLSAVVPAGGSSAKPAAVKAVANDGAAFTHTEAMNRALEASPDTRSEAVARAGQLIGDVHYPPAETIQKIAALLAVHFDDEPLHSAS